MAEFEGVNFFKDRVIHDDPYDYYDWMRAQHPVWKEPHYGVHMVTGYEEALAVYSDPATYSSCNTVAGPFTKFSVPLEGDDVSEIIDAHRHELPFSDQLPSFDPPMHTAHRGLLMRLITPKRLSENEEFMWRLADRQMVEFLDKGRHGMASTFLTRLRLGPMLVDAKGVSRLYQPRPGGAPVLLVLGAGLVMLVVLMWSIPALHDLLDLLWLKIQIVLGLNP